MIFGYLQSVQCANSGGFCISSSMGAMPGLIEVPANCKIGEVCRQMRNTCKFLCYATKHDGHSFKGAGTIFTIPTGAGLPNWLLPFCRRFHKAISL